MRIKKPVLVEVEWVDIFATCGWEKLEEVVSPTFYTYGYMVYKDKNIIKVSCTKDDSGEWFATHAFPRGCIKKIRPLERGQIKRKSIVDQVHNKSSDEYIRSIPES